MIKKIISAGVIASVAWFIVCGILYLNPVVAGVYNNYEGHPGVKNWGDSPNYLAYMYGLILVQCLLAAGAYSILKPAFTGDVTSNGLKYGLILVAVRIIPRLFDMWVQSTHPNTLLAIEVANGAIGSFVIALVIAHKIK